MKVSFTVPNPIKACLRFYFFALLFFSFFRVILFFNEFNRLGEASIFDILQAFIVGVRFDITISSYILILPYLILTISYYFQLNIKYIKPIIKYLVFLLFTLSFLVCSADIPYFNQFFSRLTLMAFEWMDNPVFVLKMIVQEPKYWVITIPFLICVFLLHSVINNITNKFIFINDKQLNYKELTISILFICLMFLGIRGRLDEKAPINVGTAYFCNNAFLNQLGLNPNFTLLRSYIDSKREENKSIQVMDQTIAIQTVQKQLGINSNIPENPLERNIIPSQNKNNYNVVIVIMESMSAAKLKRHGNTDNLTPFLNDLTYKGHYFENTYTAGIHTFNGIFSTLFSFPALFKKHPMKQSTIPQYNGIATTLKNNGYSTIYFTTHDGQFDNVEGFLKGNDFERVVTKSDYPSAEIKTTLGVPDDFMFRFSIPILNQLHTQNKPFFATFMTASDHGPYYLPEYFNPKNKSDIKKAIVEYADYSLEKFMKIAKNQPWFNNTLFVFVADHGAAMDVTYDMSLDYNHSPLLFYAPNLIDKPKTFNKMAGQIDVYPTIAGLLNVPYKNNTLGIDLLKENRPYIYCGADDKYGVLDQNWLLIGRQNGNYSLHKYQNKDTKNYASEFPEVVQKMKLYTESQLQSYQYVLNKKYLR